MLVKCEPAMSLQPVSDSAIPKTVGCQAPLSIRFSRQEHWSGLPCPPPGDLSNPGFKPTSCVVLHCRRFLYH